MKIEININVKLTTNRNRICTEFNNFFIDFVQEISQMFHPPEYESIPINDARPIFIIKEISDYAEHNQ